MEQDLSGLKIGPYEVVAPIGRGGMGMVYEGRQPLIGKRVAIKVLLKEFSRQEDVVERFLSEARAVNAIRHRGIVDIFDFGQLEDGTWYCVMEFLEGLPFDELIRTRAPFTPGDALRFCDEVLDALEAAHRAGVIHRDIKPSNLFLCDSGHGRPYVKLLDFGIAKLGSFKGGKQVGEASAVVGTPDYMAPEQARAKTISGATDLYAVGCVLFELLTRERVFEGMNAVEMMFAHVQQPPRAPSSVQVGIGRAVDAFVLRLLAKAPEERPKSAVAAREEVHLLLRELNEAPTLPPPSAFTVREPTSERVTGPTASATPRPGWNEDDQGRGATWVTPAHARRLDLPTEAATQLASGPIAFDSNTAMKPTVPEPAELAPKRGKGKLIAAGAVGALALIGGVILFTAGPDPAVRPGPVEGPADPLPPVAKPQPDPVPQPAIAAPDPTPAIDAGVATALLAPDPPPTATLDAGQATATKKPRPGLTREALSARLKKLKAQLKKKNQERGEPDQTLGMLFTAAESALKEAKTPADLKSVSETLDGLQAQLK